MMLIPASETTCRKYGDREAGHETPRQECVAEKEDGDEDDREDEPLHTFSF